MWNDLYADRVRSRTVEKCPLVSSSDGSAVVSWLERIVHVCRARISTCSVPRLPQLRCCPSPYTLHPHRCLSLLIEHMTVGLQPVICPCCSLAAKEGTSTGRMAGWLQEKPTRLYGECTVRASIRCQAA